MCVLLVDSSCYLPWLSKSRKAHYHTYREGGNKQRMCEHSAGRNTVCEVFHKFHNTINVGSRAVYVVLKTCLDIR